MGKSLVKQIEELQSPNSRPSKLTMGRLKIMQKRGYRGTNINRGDTAIYREAPLISQALLYRGEI